jgi:hypothetical protein
MIKKESFMYDEDLDKIMIFNELDEGDEIYGSTKIFNLVLDFTKTNKIANVEIRNVSEYLESLGMSSGILDDLESTEILLDHLDGGFLLTVLLRSNGVVYRVPFSIATEKEILVSS